MQQHCSNAGKIVRINLTNFMSYDNIEIHPGYNLNLIIGPNGTGKSSIVCAVLLALGGKLKTLGRADQLSSYIKSGCEECHIELELYEPTGSNVIIKRKILSDNKSEFMLNGQISTVTKINEIKKRYNIQIENLCTFLPQEKVQDFAKLNAKQLLDQTQRTVGSGNLVKLHEELKVLQNETVEQESFNKLQEDALNNEIQKNERLKDKVKCFREKQSLGKRIILLKQKKAWVSFQNEKEKKESIDSDTKLAENLCEEKKAELQKLKEELTAFDNNLESHQRRVNETKNIEAGKRAVMEERIKTAENRLDNLEDLKTDIQNKLEEEENKKREMLKYKENFEKLTNDLKTLEDNFGSEETIKQQTEEVNSRLHEHHAKQSILSKKKLELEEDREILKRNLRNIVREYEILKERKNIRLEYIKKYEPDVYKSMEWLENNRHLFRSRIYNPMLLELDVPNSKMAKFVESRISYRDLTSFTCTNPEDLNLLIKNLRTEQKLRVNAICSDEYDNTQYSPEIPLDYLRAYGFYAYMKDLITGPEEIIRFLCKTYNIHRIPVGDEKVKINNGKVPQNILTFYSENHLFRVQYSVYSGEKSVNVTKLGEPKFFGESINEHQILKLKKQKKEVEESIKSKEKEIKEIDSQENELTKNLEAVKLERKKLTTISGERQQISMNLKRTAEKYNGIKKSIKNREEIEKEADEQRRVLIKEIERNLKDIKVASEELQEATLVRQKALIQLKVTKFGKKHILEKQEKCQEEMVQKEHLLQQMRDRQKQARLKCAQLQEKAIKMTENISMEDKRFKKFEDQFKLLPYTLDDLDAEIEDAEARADFLQGGNLEILQEYEEREERIANITNTLENSKKDLENKKLNLFLKKEEWLTPINELISKISENFGKYFEAMCCAGEVCLVAGENENDFENYGIKIFVKFRDEIPLQELGRHFQSGGERAVSTAIFMLSLQELTSVPFRFVDEINQGMDPTNESRILHLIINVTSSENSTQYFFITPKLLPDVKCSDTMRVLCIYNGPNAISASEWNMDEFLRRASTLAET